MLKTTIVFRATGSSFSPTRVESETGIVFSSKNEPGDLGRIGRYRGVPTPYGSADFVGQAEQADLVNPNNELFRAIEALVPASKSAGATDMNLHLDVAFSDQCNLEMGPDFIATVGRLGVALTISCFANEGS